MLPTTAVRLDLSDGHAIKQLQWYFHATEGQVKSRIVCFFKLIYKSCLKLIWYGDFISVIYTFT